MSLNKMFGTLKNIHYNKEVIELLLKAKLGFIASNLIGPLVIIFILKDFVPLKEASTKCNEIYGHRSLVSKA